MNTTTNHKALSKTSKQGRKGMRKLVKELAAVSLVVLLAIGFPAAQNTEASTIVTETTGYCESIAGPACQDLAEGVWEQCKADGGSGPWCYCRYFRVYNGCMESFGCPGKDEQIIIDIGGDCPKIQ